MQPANPVCDSVTPLTNKPGALRNQKHTFLLLTKYYYGNQLKKIRWAGHVARMGEKRNEYRVSGREI